MKTPPFKQNVFGRALGASDQTDTDHMRRRLAEAVAAAGLNFDCSFEDMRVIALIGKRAVQEAKERAGAELSPQLVMMDIAAVHCNGCPLNLLQMLMAGPADFQHDIAGIGVEIDRATGKLMHEFVPIFKRGAS